VAEQLQSVAFKVTWVYGEHGPWTTPCTPEGRRIHIRDEGRVWCSQPECRCNDLVDTEERLPEDEEPCYDSRAPRDFRFSAGVYHDGPRAGQPIPMKQTGVGKLAFLTSRRHDMSEEDRVIIACFRIDGVGPREDYEGTFVWAEKGSPYARRVPPDRIGEAPRFWDYRKGGAEPVWGSGLFRYIPDDEAQAMWDAVDALCDTPRETVLRDLEAIRFEEGYIEGQPTTRLVSYYERNPNLRSAAIAIHGIRCQACGMSFVERYGELGEGYIEVHHLKPVSEYEGEVVVDPKEDMRVVCSNCHRMLHRGVDGPLTIEELRAVLKGQAGREPPLPSV